MNRSILMILLMVASSTIADAQTLLIYGGEDHKIFLGCLNCDKFDDRSIWNKFREYGSKVKDHSIWNKFGAYGGTFSDYSPFNEHANNPPIIVDRHGNTYGYLTANRYFNDRTTLLSALYIVENWESIMEDIGEYYDKVPHKLPTDG